jgi:hypothetical protein
MDLKNFQTQDTDIKNRHYVSGEPFTSRISFFAPLQLVTALSYSYLVPSKKEKYPLSVTHPELTKEADGWNPSSVTFGSGKKVKWKCKLGRTY